MKKNLKFAAPLAAAFAVAGCIAVDESASRPAAPQYSGVFSCDPPALDEPAVRAEGAPSADAAPRREGLWPWEELAVRAGLRSDDAKAAWVGAAARRLRVEDDLAWKNPELRFGQDWGDTRQRNSGEPPANGSGYSSSVGLRFYVPNPFVERYARAKGDADIRRDGARAALEAYGVYSEVKMLCFEAARARVEERFLAARAEACEALRQACEDAAKDGVFGSPLDTIRAETKLRRIQAKLAETETERRTLLRRIAWLADVDDDEFDVEDGPGPLPEPDQLSVEELTEIAFARRPDLAAAVAEFESAEAGLSAAKAARIPWFRFVEAAYSHDNDRENEWDRHKTGHSDEFSLKASLYLPIFTWAGNSVALSEAVRDRADERLRSLYASIRREIAAAYDDYLDAAARRRGEDGGGFAQRMEKRIAEYAASPTATATDVWKAREELSEYRSIEAAFDMAAVEARLCLEAVVGGPLPLAAAPRVPEAAEE